MEKTIEELKRENIDLRKGLKLALQYLEHPDVVAISFACNSEVLANQIRKQLFPDLEEKQQ
jgi:hypothetical protein